MSFDYLSTEYYYEIKELKEYLLYIDDEFEDFTSLDKYLYISINEWNREYPLPVLPNNILVLSIACEYKFPLNNLQSNIEVLVLNSEYDYPLHNLPMKLHLLQFYRSCCSSEYSHPINFFPESVKILKFYNVINQSSYNLPIKLKYLEFSNNTFTDEIVNYPPVLEKVNIKCTLRLQSEANLEKIEKYFNLSNLPISIKTLMLPNLKISNLEGILKRLINLESLSIYNNFENEIIEYPPNLIELYILGIYKCKLVELPPSLKIISLGWYYNSLDALANSNVEYIDLSLNKTLSIINSLPKSLKKLSIIETHFEIQSIKEQYPHIEILTLPDYDYRESLIDSWR
jgi:hypothetical protein